METRDNKQHREAGFASFGLIIVVVPLLLLVGTYLQTMTGRNQRLQTEIGEEQALLAAESGVDVALHYARLGQLFDGDTYTETLQGGSRFVANADHLGSDGLDNDGDSQVDETDEDVFQIIVTGTHGSAQRRIAAYLGFTSFIADVQSAVTLLNPNSDIQIGGTGRVNGKNHHIGGGLVGSGDTYGIATIPSGSVATLLSRLTTSERSKVDGMGGTPSLGLVSIPDINTIVTESRNAAHFVLTNRVVAGGTYGNASTGQGYIVYRDGDVQLTGNLRGAGLLVVTGNLRVTGTINWTGIIVVLGKIECGAGTAQVYGGTIMGNTGNLLDLRGTVDLRYSRAGVNIARNLAGRYVAFNGWQEISVN